jgi:hypothetical protein
VLVESAVVDAEEFDGVPALTRIAEAKCKAADDTVTASRPSRYGAETAPASSASSRSALPKVPSNAAERYGSRSTTSSRAPSHSW